MKGETILFSYGTLQDREVQQAVFQRVLEGHTDSLIGFRLLPDKVYGNYPAVEYSGDLNFSVDGVAYRLLEGELKAADAYEGPGYIRKQLQLTSGITAWVYMEKTRNGQEKEQ